eukprot:CAMPEP_0204521276 /NCGR_PEP_ID=MMETSP0661-20131031/5693_1 /ASSEMBLY_ACC=CAM_ASM_000606 /TAXON_ID=109239 /ORGANISM="Alexandrium margalefi, Strain AMGDE01CS-322" /LENGTH=177 /DNA_ID=CAMNT_0051526861 /DNA_START=134 /DNA_END=667 /DNA_ORIENTATION=+
MLESGSSGGVLRDPLAGRLVVLRPVLQVQLRDLGDQRVVGVRVREQRREREQDLGDCEGGAPLVLQDVEADRSVRVHVAVVDLGGEVELRRLEGVVRRELYAQEEHPPGVGGVRRAHDGRLPVEHVVADGAGRAARRRVRGQVLQLLLYALQCHSTAARLGKRHGTRTDGFPRMTTA